MMFKNSCKLLFANFSQVWKLLVYHILSIAFCFGLLCVFYHDFIDIGVLAYEQAGMKEVWSTGTMYGTSFTNALTRVANFVIYFFEIMFASNIGKGIYFVFVIFILLPILINIGKVVTCELLYGFMSACQKQSFTGTFLKTLKTSLVYSSLKAFYALPFNAIVLAGMWGLTRIGGGFFAYILPYVFVILSALLMAVKELFNAGWAPAKVVYNQNIFKSYRIGMRAVFRRGARIFSTAFVIYLLALVLSMVLGLYAIIIILPIISPLVHIFEMVAFFSSQGMRFYVDGDTILSPKRLEEVDKIEDAKYII